MSDREVDAKVQSLVFGSKVVGLVSAMCPDGCWSIHGEAKLGDEPGWPTSVQPAYLSHPDLDDLTHLEGWPDKEEHIAYGHWSGALDIVPHYTTDPAADYAILCHVREKWPLGSTNRDVFQKQLYEIFGERMSDDLPDSDLDKYVVGDYSRAALATVTEQVT